jgi:hypothetical protein
MMFPHDIPHRPVAVIGFPGQKGRLFIANMGQQGRNDADTVIYPVLALTVIGFQSFEQMRHEGPAGIGQTFERNRLYAMTGSMTFSSNCPFSTASVIARSFPMT